RYSQKHSETEGRGALVRAFYVSLVSFKVSLRREKIHQRIVPPLPLSLLSVPLTATRPDWRLALLHSVGFKE
ncbi:hypothetical protein JOQ06_025416, partial [Pogonophryne albipinna]